MSVSDAPTATERGANIVVSYNELVTIRTLLATIQAQLQAALALQGKVDSLEHRVVTVEIILAGKTGERKSWNTMLGFMAGVVTMALGGGALKYLPMLWGG